MIYTRIVRTGLMLLVLSASTVLMQCGYVQQLQQGLTNLGRCKFKLQNVTGFMVAGVTLSDKHSVSDFGLLDGAKLAQAFASKKFPANMTINLAATNPNDGSGGYPKTTATLVGFPWTLLIDNQSTISGDIGGRPEIPGTGQTAIIPLSTSIDLYQFFADKGYDSIINLAMAIGGANGSAARLTLRGTPRVSTPLGDVSYPQPIDVVNKEFRN